MAQNNGLGNPPASSYQERHEWPRFCPWRGYPKAAQNQECHGEIFLGPAEASDTEIHPFLEQVLEIQTKTRVPGKYNGFSPARCVRSRQDPNSARIRSTKRRAQLRLNRPVPIPRLCPVRRNTARNDWRVSNAASRQRNNIARCRCRRFPFEIFFRIPDKN